MQARKQQSELQDEYGIGADDQDEHAESSKPTKTTKFSLTTATKSNNDDLEASGSSGFNFRPFKKLQTSRFQQQQIRKSDHDDSDSDSDTDEQLEDCENKRDFYSDEEIVIFLI